MSQHFKKPTMGSFTHIWTMEFYYGETLQFKTVQRLFVIKKKKKFYIKKYKNNVRGLIKIESYNGTFKKLGILTFPCI